METPRDGGAGGGNESDAAAGGRGGLDDASGGGRLTLSELAGGGGRRAWSCPLFERSIDGATRRTLAERQQWCGDWLCLVDGPATSGGNGGDLGDAFDREWYQALSFVAWQAATPAASQADLAAALLTTSTLGRLDEACARLGARRQGLCGMAKLVEIM